MSPRASLPGADELFETTGPAAAAAEQPSPVRHAVHRRVASTGRERHDEKITVYVSAPELLALEHARLSLRAEHGVAVDRGRIVREALAVLLADLDSARENSLVAQRLRDNK